VGVLAAVLDGLREVGINVQEMENTIFAGGNAAAARIAVHGRPSESALSRMRANEHVLHVSVVPIEVSS
jgi:D-3-phosphoglycerate dehydrogenase